MFNPVKRFLIATIYFLFQMNTPSIDNTQPIDYDHMRVVLTWVPTFCADPNLPVPCKSPMPEEFTLHGLWACYDNGNVMENCHDPGTADLDNVFNSLGWTNLESAWPSVTRRPADGLWRHEYHAHGICADPEVDAKGYFTAAEREGRKFKRDLGPVFTSEGIIPSNQNLYTKGRIIAAVRKAISSTSNKFHILLSCQSINNTHTKLYEVHICLDQKLANYADCLGSVSGCGSHLNFVLPPKY